MAVRKEAAPIPSTKSWRGIRLAVLISGICRRGRGWLFCSLALASPLAAQPSGIESTLNPGLEAAPPPALPDGYPSLAATSWALVQFVRPDGSRLTPISPARYTLRFDPGGSAALQLDCNRANGAWIAAANGALSLGPLAGTRAMCADMTLHDRILADAPEVRGYLVDQGHLWLSLSAGGGAYEFAPAPAQ